MRDQRRRKPYRPQHDLMRRLLVIEAKAVAVVPDRLDAGERGGGDGAFARPRPLPIRIVGRMRRVERKRVQNVGQQQLLMLLLVIEPDLDDRNEPAEIARGFDQRRHRLVDMGAIGGDLGGARTRHQAALRPRLARPGGDVIGIVQISETLIERRGSLWHRAAAETARRTTSHARDATWSGWRRASTGRPGPPATASRRGARSRRARRENCSAKTAADRRPAVSTATSFPAAGWAGSASRTRLDKAEPGMIKVRKRRD